jgi:hypothetical protein
MSPKGHPTSPEKAPGSSASEPNSGQKAYIAPPLQRPFIFLHRKYLETEDEQLEKLKGDIETKTKKFNEQQRHTGASLAKLVVRSHPSGFYIGYTRIGDLKRLHNLLKGQPLFGNKVRFRLVLDPSAPKVCQATRL